MAKNYEVIKKKDKSVVLDGMFVSDYISEMTHLQVAYTEKGALEPRAIKKKGKKPRAGLHGDAYIMSAKDLRTPIEEGGVVEEDETYRDFIRLICVKRKIADKKDVRSAYIVDASHLELGPDALLNNKFDSHRWKKKDGTPLPILRLITNPLDLEIAQQDIQEHYGLILPQSELIIMRNEQIL